MRFPKALVALLLASCSFHVGEPHGAELGVGLSNVLPLAALDEDLERPVWFGAIPGGLEDAGAWHALALQEGQVLRIFLERSGRVRAVQPWFDLSDEISRVGNEEGLLGLAFHPDFPRDPRLFVHFSARGEPRGQIWELPFDAPSDLPGVRTAPELARERGRLVFEIAQPYRNHNGGEIRFGNDRMLYVGLGDGGSAGDPYRAGQDLGNLLGKILRIDVDVAPEERVEGTGYGIPADNPFVGTAGARGEVWALGLRNPWRFDFDPEREGLWVGDVGQNRFEEVDFVERGGNYGWSCREGFATFDAKTAPATEPLRDPVLDYPRKLGASVTGGAVYTGEDVRALHGRYVYADYASGVVWAIEADPGAPGDPNLLVKVGAPASFGVDAWGELYVLSFASGLHRMVGTEPQQKTTD